MPRRIRIIGHAGSGRVSPCAKSARLNKHQKSGTLLQNVPRVVMSGFIPGCFLGKLQIGVVYPNKHICILISTDICSRANSTTRSRAMDIGKHR